ncbi:hypothetical protein BSKO_10363 [Bryopsis sp. KO-2023]|nr:hypothetical protein BSKO_10363 [Bryopsis sp. KO-2023]
MPPKSCPRGCLFRKDMVKESEDGKEELADEKAAARLVDLEEESDSGSDGAFNFPDNVLADVLGKLPGKCIARASCVCRQWSKVALSDQRLWKTAYCADYGDQALKRPELSWRSLYHLEWTWRGRGKSLSRSFAPPRGPDNDIAPDVKCVDFNRKILVAGDDTGVIHIWDMQTREHKGAVRLGKNQTVACCLQVHESMVVSGCEDGTIRVWDTEGLRCTHLFRGHEGPVLCVQFLPGMIVSGSHDAKIMTWDLNAPGSSPRKRIGGFVKPVRFLQASGRCIVGGSEDSVGVWDVDTGQRIKMIGLLEDSGSLNKVLFDGWKVAIGVSGESFQCIEVWDVEGDRCERIHSIYVSSLSCFTLDGMRIIGRKMTSTKICMWDLKSGKRIKTLGEHEGDVVHLSMSGKRLVTASTHRMMEIREWGCPKRVKSVETQANESDEGGASTGCFSSERLAKFTRQSAKLMKVFQNNLYGETATYYYGN